MNHDSDNSSTIALGRMKRKGQVWFGVQWRSVVIRHGLDEWDSTLRLILLVIGDVMDNETGTASISMEKIAQYSGLQRETVTRRLKQAFDEGLLRGWLVRQKQHSEGGRPYFVYRGQIPESVKKFGDAEIRDGESPRPVTLTTRIGDGSTAVPVTEDHPFYLGTYLNSKAERVGGSDDPPRDGSREQVKQAFADELTEGGRIHVCGITGTQDLMEALDRLPAQEARNVAATPGYVRNPIPNLSVI